MKTVEQVAVAMLRTALASAPDEIMFDGLTAQEIALVAAHNIITCPRCGSEAWVNIDCFVCEIAGALEAGEDRPYTLAKWNIF